ncbi:MAG TPA: hypothetical protein VGQ83_03965 [Polyangia bacterium]
MDSPSTGEVLLWVPRVILFPVHLVLEYGLRWPLAELVMLGEEHHLEGWIRWLLTWRGGTVGVFPTFYYDFGLKPSIGFYFFAGDLLASRDRFSLAASFWDDWTQVRAQYRAPLFRDRSGTTVTAVVYSDRPDWSFHGVGPATTQDRFGYFRLTLAELAQGVSTKLGSRGTLTLGAAVRSATFGDGLQPTISESFPAADPRLVPGFTGYRLISEQVGFVLDSRPPARLEASSGVRLDLRAAHGFDPTDRDLQLLRWGAAAAGFLDLSGRGHVIELGVTTAFVEQLAPQPVPLTELVTFGGTTMRGFVEGRFRGASGFIVGADYRYPVWSLLEADLFASVGNVFNGHLDDFSFARMFLCWGLGVRTTNSREVAFEMLIGFGSNRLDAPRFEVEKVRGVFGVVSRF